MLQLLFALAGLIANPDFAVGSEATSVLVLGVDFNGWHALSGILLWAPGIYAARRAELAVAYAWTAMVIVLLTAGWTLLDERPAWVLWFPHPTADTVLHVGSAAALGVLLMADRVRR